MVKWWLLITRFSTKKTIQQIEWVKLFCFRIPIH